MEEVITLKSKFLRGVFEQNTYVVLKKNEAVLIDAGAELDDIKNVVKNRKVLAVLLTHIHFDHIWNLIEILNEFNCNVYIVSGNEYKFNDYFLNGSFLIRKDMKFDVPNNRICFYNENLKLGKFEFKIYNTPGHSKDCVCLLLKDILFTGDTIFSDTIGRTDFADSSFLEMEQSLNKIKNIPFKRAYPGHYESCDRDAIIKVIEEIL